MIPNNISQTALNRLAAADEKLAVVIAVNGSGLGTYTVQGRTNRTFAFQFNRVRGAHVLRFPASFWNNKKAEVARELFDHNAALPMVPTVEPWDSSRDLAELVMPEKIAAPIEEPPAQPDTDPAPTGNGLAVLLSPNEDELAEARRIGAEDYHKGKLSPDNPFTLDTHADLSLAWQNGFEEAEKAAVTPPPAEEPEVITTVEPEPVVVEVAPEPTPEPKPAPIEEPPAIIEPAAGAGDVFRIEGSDIFLGEERVGGLFDPGNHLRMAQGKTDLRDEVKAFLATLPSTEPEQTEP